MRRVPFYVIVGLFSIVLLFISVTPVTSNVDQDNNIIVIGAGVATAYNVTEIPLKKNTEYTIVFEIFQEGNFHNLIIDRNRDVSETNLDDNNDLHIGITNDAIGLGGETVWNATWTTPNEDIEISYFCGIPGHFALGMSGKFIIGTPTTAGFEPFILVFAFLGLAFWKVQNSKK